MPLPGVRNWTVTDTIDALLPLIEPKTTTQHVDRTLAHHERACTRLDALGDQGHRESPLHPQYTAATIDRLAAPDAIFTADAGTPCIWATRC